MAERGRPKKPINWETVKKLAALHCTQKEIARFIGVIDDTLCSRAKRELKREWTELYENWSADGKISLRRWQWKSAQDGSETMQIWLGKQYLGQTNNGLKQDALPSAVSTEKQEIDQLVNWLEELDKV